MLRTGREPQVAPQCDAKRPPPGSRLASPDCNHRTHCLLGCRFLHTPPNAACCDAFDAFFFLFVLVLGHNGFNRPSLHVKKKTLPTTDLLRLVAKPTDCESERRLSPDDSAPRSCDNTFPERQALFSQIKKQKRSSHYRKKLCVKQPCASYWV